VAVLLDHFYEAVELQIDRRVSLFQEAPDDAVRESAIVDMRSILNHVKGAQDNLGWLEAARRSPLDLGSRWFVEDVARSLIVGNFELAFISEAHRNYETTTDPYESTITDWGNGIPAGEPTNVLIYLPRREESSSLLHPLIIHELGHIADQRLGLVERIWAQAEGRANFGRRFAAAAEAIAAEKDCELGIGAEAIGKWLRHHLAESLCDSIAVHILGPTYLYSFLVEVAAGNMDDPPLKHPPPRQRVRRILADLDRLGWGQAMDAGDPALMAWVRELAAVTNQPEGWKGFAYWCVDDLQSLTRKVAREAVEGRIFRPDGERSAEVELLLDAGIPPAQLLCGDPVPRELIILACWSVALRSAGGGPANLPGATERPELGEILPAALELSAVAEAWEEG
jgi:hypothetical protein